jgi:hypothetical protein
VLVHPFNWKKASMAAALCYGVRGGGAQLAFHVTPGNYDTDSLIEVLEGLRRVAWRIVANVGPRRLTAAAGRSGDRAATMLLPPRRLASARFRETGGRAHDGRPFRGGAAACPPYRWL